MGSPRRQDEDERMPKGIPPKMLDGIRIIDLTTVIFGPYATQMLADLGADVIKIERPDGGDSLRNMGWRDPVDGEGLWWRLVNRNKRTIALNLKDETDRDLFLRLIDDADVLVENFRPGVLEKLGFAPEVLHARNAKLIITRVSGFGQDGPYANRPGFASIAEAMSGLASITGVPGGDPMLPPFALTDEVTGLVAAFATMVGGNQRHLAGVVDLRQPRQLAALDAARDEPCPERAHALLGLRHQRLGGIVQPGQRRRLDGVDDHHHRAARGQPLRHPWPQDMDEPGGTLRPDDRSRTHLADC